MHLHTNNIVHSDLALRNILYSETVRGYRVAISDFGLAHTVDNDSEITHFAYRWAAPELLSTHK